IRYLGQCEWADLPLAFVIAVAHNARRLLSAPAQCRAYACDNAGLCAVLPAVRPRHRALPQPSPSFEALPKYGHVEPAQACDWETVPAGARGARVPPLAGARPGIG